MRLGDLADLPPTLTTEQAAQVWGCSPDHLWGLARTDRAPVAPLHLGRKLVWPTTLVLRSVGVEPTLDGEPEGVVALRRAADG
jgi:hypothetical protein